MVELDIINNDYYYIMQDTIFGTHVGQNPLRDPCSGDSGGILTLLYTEGAIMIPPINFEASQLQQEGLA